MLTLASRLRALDDAALRRVIVARSVPTAGIRDFFDLAETLLSPASLDQALGRLDRATLATLALAGEMDSVPTLSALADRLTALSGNPVAATDLAPQAELLGDLMLGVYSDDTLTPYDAVRAYLAGWPARGLPDATELAAAKPPAPVPAPTEADAARISGLAAEHAFSAVSSMVELVGEIAREPVRELSRGGLGLPDTKRLALVASVPPESVESLVAIAARADLVSRENGTWQETEDGEAWLQSGTADRWVTLAASWRAALPDDVLRILPSQVGASWGAELRDHLDWLYPAGGAWLNERVAAVQDEADLLGIIAQAATSAPGAAVLDGDFERAAEVLASLLPAEVGTVYLQHDLSVVSPGPLSPSIDARLRGLADVESREMASSYRITASSINRALAGGETAASILEFLRGISLTGIPQPVEYLISESAERFGRLRVRRIDPDDPGGPTVVRSTDLSLLGMLEVDQALLPLGLHRSSEDTLTSRFSLDVVFWALSDARYPVAAEDADGNILHLRRTPLAHNVPPPVTDPIGDLIASLRSSDGDEGEAAGAWLARQLDAAIRSKQTVTVSIAMPGGVVVDYLLEPASVGGGRFRARDRRADIERTLPISSIISITPAP